MIKILESLYTLCNFRYEVSANTPPAPEKIDTTVLVHALGTTQTESKSEKTRTIGEKNGRKSGEQVAHGAETKR